MRQSNLRTPAHNPIRMNDIHYPNITMEYNYAKGLLYADCLMGVILNRRIGNDENFEEVNPIFTNKLFAIEMKFKDPSFSMENALRKDIKPEEVNQPELYSLSLLLDNSLGRRWGSHEIMANLGFNIEQLILRHLTSKLTITELRFDGSRAIFGSAYAWSSRQGFPFQSLKDKEWQAPFINAPDPEWKRAINEFAIRYHTLWWKTHA